MKKRSLIISDADRHELEALIRSARMDPQVRTDYLASLKGELSRARIVPPGEVPANVVTMNSVVRLRDMDTGETEEFELVYPWEVDAGHNRVSILAPIGTAILGYRLGDIIEWPVPAGLRRLREGAVSTRTRRRSAELNADFIGGLRHHRMGGAAKRKVRLT